MRQHQRLDIVAAAQCHAEKIADADIDRHPHAEQSAAQHDAFAIKLDVPDAAIGAQIVRVELDGQGKGVEPQRTARPCGSYPACCCLTPHGLFSPPGLCSRSMGESMPELRPFRLKKAG